MERVLQTGGTAYGLSIPGISIAGKTGTAQAGGSRADHSVFVCFAPVEKPKIAIAVFVENGGFGASNAAPIAPIHLASATGMLDKGEIALDVNGERRQRGDLRDMVWNVPDMLAFLSQLYRLEPGDLVFTGTPAGVGPVVVGDRLEGRIAGLTPLAIEIVAPVD